MEIKSFDTILTQLCDDFDYLISPKKIARSNTNIIYLLFKAIAKGYEVINNACVVLSNKFNPAKCSEEDLVSVASLVGTERRAGSASGLHVIVTNSAETAKTLLAGVYTYNLDDDTQFEFEVVADTVIQAGESTSYIAMSDKVGRFPVTAQQSIEVDSGQAVDDDLTFSCTDNENLLGNEPESILAFRKRILNTYNRQNTIVELEEYLRNLPYLFDCKVKYNQSDNDIVVGDVVIPPMYCAIFIAGEIKQELAEMVADYIICPTVATQDSVAVNYNNDIFAGGHYTINLIPFVSLDYEVDIYYSVESEYVNIYDAKEKIEKALFTALASEKHIDVVKEEDVYNVLEAIENISINVLAVNLKVDNTDVNYVDVPADKIAKLVHINFIEG